MTQETSIADWPIPIEDPDFYLNDPWPAFSWMQKERPFYHYAPLDTYVITRHRDIRDIAAQADNFGNERGIFLNEIKFRAQAGDSNFSEGFWPKGGEQIGNTDPPRHTELRRVANPAFSIAALEALEKPIAEHVNHLLDEMKSGDTIDWWKFTAAVPIEAACHLIGLAATDRNKVQHWSDELEKLGADLSFEELQAAMADFKSLQDYITDNVNRRKAEMAAGAKDGTDLISVLLNAEIDSGKVKLPTVITFAMTAMAAGSDTTRALLLGLAHQFAEYPEQWEILRKDRSLVKNAIEEVLRWVTPARAFVRFVKRDTEVNGQKLNAGQYVYLMYMAANRDEEAFKDAHRFDVTRSDASRHVAFGAGPHICLGARLARLEGTVVLNAMLDRFSGLEFAGEPKRVHHIIRNSWDTIPIRVAR